MIRVGLRFDRQDAAHLRMLARQVQNNELRGQRLSGLLSAAESAETGEPLIVQCESADEATRMAESFIALGVRRPAVEELTGHRPAK